MDPIGRNAKVVTPVKDPHGSPFKVFKSCENLNPNVSRSSPGPKTTNSQVIRSVKSQKSATKNSSPSVNPVVFSPRNKIRERRFVVAKKISKKDKVGFSSTVVDCKCKEKLGGNANKCLCLAYETLRASQEEFFKNRNGTEQIGQSDSATSHDRAEAEVDKEIAKCFASQNIESEGGYGSDNQVSGETVKPDQMGSSTIKRRRDKVLEEARNSVPESGKVRHLVQAFENLGLISAPKTKQFDKKDENEAEDNNKKAMKWALPALQPPKAPETEVPFPSFSPSDFCLTSENLGLDSRFSISSSWDSSQGSVSSRTSNGGRRSPRNSLESRSTMGGRRWKKKQLKITNQQPFKLRTEQRGKMKEEEFMKKLQEMMTEEERQRIPIAQGLPWTTDEPENLIKPPVKENTRPIDLKLHSDMRASERAEFDQQVAEKLSLIEQYKVERERQQKLAEEEEIKRLRKELVPKAQPMPYFDRPFIPRRSMKHPTVPREPKFHIPQHKKIKCCLSWNDISPYTYEHHCSEASED